MTASLPTTFYTLRRIEEMLGLGRSVVAALIHAGFVSPGRGPRNEYRFSFQDVVLLRTAHQLRQSNISPRRMLRSLRQLKAKLPEKLPLSGLRIKAVGNDVAVRDGDAPWEAATGQMLMDFEVAALEGSVSFLDRTESSVQAGSMSGAEWFRRGQALESGDINGAENAYRQALVMEPGNANAYLNLGALLCEDGRCEEAVALYDRAILKCPLSAAVHFNRALALEDRGSVRDALASYQQCLALDPTIADAHFNAARLHEKLGEAQHAIRHYSAYRRLK